MKKIYLQPQVEVEKMALEEMIAASETVGLSETTVDPSTADSRIVDDFFDMDM